ncbi:hypothetical protein C7T87_25825, partial [Xanthomonas hortorum pv. hederae]
MRGRVEAAGPLEGPNGQSVHLDRIQPLGALSPTDLQQRLRLASIFCAPSLYEPFGLGVLEAAQAGCALVLADIPTFRELWEGAALFVSPQDDAALAELLVFHFKREDFEVVHTPDGEEALLLARENTPDIVLLDWMVEGISGIEVCRRLRRAPETANVPII